MPMLCGDTAENFRNRKCYFSINVQAMCNARLKFQNIVARWPGSTHDSMIFLNSAAKWHFDNNNFNNGIILADSGYFLNNYLITPLTAPQSPAQRLYNESQIRTRNVIERCFGVWKRPFPVLSIGMRCKLPLVQDIIVASAIIHNLAIEMHEEEPPVDPEVNVQVELTCQNMEFVISDDSDTRNSLLEYFESLIRL
ncbi:PREDICTED: putative nuclease HARBI1 isoform X1 [Rhagoletis zephyria]|uniref:putative nuclease HARBI1 isoform X1 n=1 Tax=Rhagoletis zephyria TaxID=28612 RepID=UPI00081192E9|nr:PREDICTED: putative nuclease HARBI1 isoform X1 [Rhagoletis zephyria]